MENREKKVKRPGREIRETKVGRERKRDNGESGRGERGWMEGRKEEEGGGRRGG